MPYADPADKRAHHREYMRERRAGERGARRASRALTAVKTPFTAKGAADVRDLLLEQVNAVRADPEASVIERARAVGYLSVAYLSVGGIVNGRA